MVVVYLHLLPKVQLHVSALNSHLQIVHESFECSYTRLNMGRVHSPYLIFYITSRFNMGCENSPY